jgi:DNA repair protein RadC
MVSVHLRVERELPSAIDSIPVLMREAGVHTQTQEVMWVCAYDSIMQVRHIIEVARGGYHQMEVSIPAIMTAVLTAGTDRFLIAHNHSTGDVTPTTLDVELTRKVMAAANTCGLYFEDHLILGPSGEEFSMAEEGILVPAKELRTMARTQRRAKV